MAKICTNEKTASRQRWIENGLLELMQDRSFDTLSVTELCRYLALSRRSFYRYFQDLEDVLASALEHAFQGMVIANTPLTLRELEDNYNFWLSQRLLLTALARSGMYGKLTEYALKYADAESAKPHLADPELSREIQMFIISGSVSLLIGWYAEGFQKTPAQMARIAYRMLYEPLLTKP